MTIKANIENGNKCQVHFVTCAYRQCRTTATTPANDIESDAATPQDARILLTDDVNGNMATSNAPRLIRAQTNGRASLQKIFIDDLTERRRLWRVPWFIVLMCLVQIAFHLIANDCIQQRLIFIPAYKSEYWRYFTYMLLHSDLLHLLLNLCLQCLLGFCLELEQGHCRIACIYVAGGISGSLVTALLQPQLSLLGASAGVYALFISHIPHLVKNFTQLPHRYLRIVALLILSLSDIGFTTFHILVNHNTQPKICLEAHIAGGIAGLLIGFIVYRRLGGRGNVTGRDSTNCFCCK